MLEKTKDWLFPAIIITIILAGIMFVGYLGGNAVKSYPSEDSVGSVERTNEYHATTTVLITGTTYKAAQTRHLIQSASQHGPVTLGSVVIASTTDNIMAIYNATSSDAVINGDGTLITTFPVNAPQGTYTFDIILSAGLVLDLAAGFGGDFVVSYR